MSAVVAQPGAGRPWRSRHMLRGDLDQVVAIESQVYPFPWSRGNFVDSLAAGYDAWVFECDGETIGYAILMWIPDEVHLLNLSVAARHQGAGRGAELLEWLAADATRRGARTMLLEVRPSNLRALRLYERHGFRRIGIRRRYYPAADNGREDAIVMVRRLVGANGAGSGNG
jgi:[ribosomal protein S18]-alanine N-acetyltransferase